MADWKNKLFFGNNLDIMKRYIPDNFIDLIYLDPPFNSKATYNVLFKESNGTASDAQITAFEDTWHWDLKAEETYHDLVVKGSKKLSDLIQAFRSFLGQNDMMAYLVMMSIRLDEMHRVLKLTGSLYLHCDPTASHYLKLIMDAIFGPENFLNEIVWCYKEREMVIKKWNSKHDIILFYSKTVSEDRVFNWDSVAEPYSKVTISKFKYRDERGLYQIRGRNIKGSPIKAADGLRPEHEDQYPGLTYRDYLESRTGVPPRDWWTINIINKAAKERLGYPTQKPEALLERLIKASSNVGDIILDPFCGCGTSIAVAERLKRKWIGIDITHLAITLIRHRLEACFSTCTSSVATNSSPLYEVIGDPKDVNSAKALAEHDRYQFEWWALGKVSARPSKGMKKGADKGIDGYLYFFDDDSGKAKKIIVQVKSGHINRSHIATLKGDMEREKAQIGALLTLNEPTRPMKDEALAAGFYLTKSNKAEKFPKVQILTIKDLLEGRDIFFPR